MLDKSNSGQTAIQFCQKFERKCSKVIEVQITIHKCSPTSKEWTNSVFGMDVSWGDRVVIPQAGREKVLKILHEGHPGILRMKRIARGVVWWPKIDTAIEKTVQDCQACQLHQKSPAPTPLHPWEWLTRPWSRIHIDHTGPFMGKTFFVLVDARTFEMDGCTHSTINKFRKCYFCPQICVCYTWLTRDSSIRQWNSLH